MSFKTINLDEYKRLLKNKNKMYDLTFPTPESLNKYRDKDENINQKILHDEEIDKQNENLSQMFDKNLNKYFNEKKNSNLPFDIDLLNLGNNSTDLIKLDKNENELKDVFEIDDNYKFITDEDILNSFDKVFKDYKVIYTPYKKTKNISVKYLLDKLYNSDTVPKEIFNHFDTILTDLRKKSKKIPVEYLDSGQTIIKGDGYSNDNIKIKDLDKGILRVRYSNNRKLTNKFLKDDYKISKRMVNAIKFNKDIHKLSKDEKNIYYELQKFLNKDQDINVLIGSYISGNNSKTLYNKINKMLYNKLKNNLISKREYSSLLDKINKS